MGVAQKIEALRSLLDKENTALVSGETGAIEEFLTQKQQMLHALETQQVSPEDLAEIRARLRRNQDLIEGTLEGMRAAFERLRDVQTVAQGLKTYGPEGGIVTHQFRGSRLSRRS